MPRSNHTLPTLASPEVLEERNRRLAALVGKRMGYGADKTRDLCRTIGLLAADPAPEKLVEYLYQRIWTVQAGVKREDIQKAIARCHEDALGWLQNTCQNLHE